MYQVDNFSYTGQCIKFNYTEWCNELIITIDNSIELTTLLCLMILTQLVNYVLAPHNTKISFLTHNQIFHKKPLSHIETVSLFELKELIS